VWGRMAVWFLGVAITMSFLSVCQTLFKWNLTNKVRLCER
jgi:hypothetical protein